jgi:hypothetical protein
MPDYTEALQVASVNILEAASQSIVFLEWVSMGIQILMLLKEHNVLIFKGQQAFSWGQLIFGHTASQYQ